VPLMENGEKINKIRKEKIGCIISKCFAGNYELLLTDFSNFSSKNVFNKNS
jgi:hypothetical protein